MIVFELEEAALVNIELYDVTGTLLQIMPAKKYEAGQHQERITATGLADGIYYCKVNAENKIVTEKLVVLHAQSPS